MATKQNNTVTGDGASDIGGCLFAVRAGLDALNHHDHRAAIPAHSALTGLHGHTTALYDALEVLLKLIDGGYIVNGIDGKNLKGQSQIEAARTALYRASGESQ